MKEINILKENNINIIQNVDTFYNPDYIFVPINSNCSLPNHLLKNDFINEKKVTVSGYVKDVISFKENVFYSNYVAIENDFKELNCKNNTKKTKFDYNNLLDILIKNKENKLVNKLKNVNKITNLVISAINEEPYIYNNIYILKENINNLLELIDNLSMEYKVENIYLVVKNNDAGIINDCLNAIGTYPSIKLTLVNDEYLLGFEKFLIKKLNINKNYLYLNVEELNVLANYRYGLDNSFKYVTISGNALKESKVIKVKKYCILDEILKNNFEIIEKDYDIIVNGLMKGFRIIEPKEMVISDEIFGINVMKKREYREEECIKCGKCYEVCPYNVNIFTKENIDKCINCNLCSYVCPSFINIKKIIANYGGKNE